MKITTKKNSGNILMVTLVTAAVLGVGLASYFRLVEAQNNAVMRSQNWNSAIPAAEAGLEEALTHLNIIGAGNRATNGWTLVGTNYVLSRTINAFRYSVAISPDSQPSITSTGYAKVPRKTNEIERVIRVTTSRFGTGMRGMVAIGNITMNGNTMVDSFDSENPTYNTGGRYDAAKRKDGGFVGSVQGNVTTGGGDIAGIVATGATGAAAGDVGDFPWLASSSGIQSGHYQNDLNISFPPVAPPFNGGASSPNVNYTITLTNFTYVTTSTTTNVMPSPFPASGVTTNTAPFTAVTVPAGTPGPITTNTSPMSSKIMPVAGTYVGNIVTRIVTTGPMANRGTWYDFARITGYTYNTKTYTYNLVTTNATTTTASYAYQLGTGNYQMSDLSLSGQSKMLITGDAVLYITGNMSMAGQSEIVIAPGASLKVYVGGSTTKFAGNGIQNSNADATKFSYYGLPGNTSIAISGNAAFTGTIYAPSADMSLNGGGTTVYDVVGASVTKTVDMHGHFKFHYDEKLGRTGGATRYNVASWNEI